MANLEFCDTHNMVAYLLKTERSEATREVQITAIIDGKVKLVSEASIRRHLKLKDSDGISTFPNTKIFEQLALMGFSTLVENASGTISMNVPSAGKAYASLAKGEKNTKDAETNLQKQLINLLGIELWSLVKERFSTTEPTDDKKKEL
nr:hypothetical protein [Tanacetum cinerariifolium]